MGKAQLLHGAVANALEHAHVIRINVCRGEIGRAVLASLHGPRRPRVCARTVKSPLSRWHARPDGKPRTTRQITSIDTDIDAAHYRPPKPRLTLIDKIRQAAERGEPVDHLLKRLTSLHCIWRRFRG